MKRSSIIVAVAAVLTALIATTAALAGQSNGKTLFRYAGQLTSVSGSNLTVTVQNGNRRALRSLLDQSASQTFATDEKTVVLRWTDGEPKQLTSISELEIGDYVAVNIRTNWDAKLEDILKTPANLVGEHGKTWNKPDKPLYLFRGAFVGTGADTVTIDVKGGNRRALKLMIEQPRTQTFKTGPDTVFLCWAKRIPTVIDASGLKDCGRIVIRVRADAGLTLGDVEQTPAKRVAGHEPRAQEANQSAQS